VYLLETPIRPFLVHRGYTRIQNAAQPVDKRCPIWSNFTEIPAGDPNRMDRNGREDP